MSWCNLIDAVAKHMFALPNPMPYPHPAAIPVRIDFFSAYFLIHRCTIAFSYLVSLPSSETISPSREHIAGYNEISETVVFCFYHHENHEQMNFSYSSYSSYFTFQTADRSQEATVATDGIKYKYMQNICHRICHTIASSRKTGDTVGASPITMHCSLLTLLTPLVPTAYLLHCIFAWLLKFI